MPRSHKLTQVPDGKITRYPLGYSRYALGEVRYRTLEKQKMRKQRNASHRRGSQQQQPLPEEVELREEKRTQALDPHELGLKVDDD